MAQQMLALELLAAPAGDDGGDDNAPAVAVAPVAAAADPPAAAAEELIHRPSRKFGEGHDVSEVSHEVSPEDEVSIGIFEREVSLH